MCVCVCVVYVYIWYTYIGIILKRALSDKIKPPAIPRTKPGNSHNSLALLRSSLINTRTSKRKSETMDSTKANLVPLNEDEVSSANVYFRSRKLLEYNFHDIG